MSSITDQPGAVTAVPEQHFRTNSIRDGLAATLLVLAVLLPWNIYFGVAIPGTTGWVLGLLVLATLLALAGVLLSHVGPFGIRRTDGDVNPLNRLRLALTVPYFVVAASFVAFAVLQTFRTGGTSEVPPGIGPGAWFGIAGAVLAAQPLIVGDQHQDERQGARAARIIGITSMLLATAAVLFTLYWRTRFVLPHIGDDDTGTQNMVVAVTAVLYGLVNLLPVIIVSRWLLSVARVDRLATVLLAAAVLVAGLFVWVFPIGRELDAFHGIAQITSTAGVGFEGYLAWVAAAAIIGTATLLTVLNRSSVDVWRGAARKGLVLIAAWCAGSAVLRFMDIVRAAVLDLPDPPYNYTALMAFDLVVAVLATWLFVNSSGRAAPRLLLTLLFGILSVLAVCRVILGVALVPRSQPLNPDVITDVYGNTLVQQVTSTFDVALCVLAFALLAVAIVSAGAAAPKATRVRAGASATAKAAVPVDDSPPTTVIPARTAEPTIAIATGQSAPTIAMPAKAGVPGGETATAKIAAPDRVADVLAESTQRFAAGTTYGGAQSGTAED